MKYTQDTQDTQDTQEATPITGTITRHGTILIDREWNRYGDIEIQLHMRLSDHTFITWSRDLEGEGVNCGHYDMNLDTALADFFDRVS